MLGILIHMCFNTEIFDLQKSLLPEKNGKKRRGGGEKRNHSSETTTERRCRHQSKIMAVKGQDDIGNINLFI